MDAAHTDPLPALPESASEGVGLRYTLPSAVGTGLRKSLICEAWFTMACNVLSRDFSHIVLFQMFAGPLTRLAVLAALTTPLWAAPVATMEEVSKESLGADHRAAVDANEITRSGNATIDKLLSVQGSPAAGTAVNGLPRGLKPAKLSDGALATNADANEAAASAANPLAAMQEYLLSTHPAAPQRADTAATNQTYRANDSAVGRTDSGSSPSTLTYGGRTGSQDPAPQGALFNALRLVRENRAWVISICVAALLVMWGVASYSSQGSRRH